MNQHLTPDEVEVGRRNLIAELRDGVADGMDVSAGMVRDLIAVLEVPAARPAESAPIPPSCSNCGSDSYTCGGCGTPLIGQDWRLIDHLRMVREAGYVVTLPGTEPAQVVTDEAVERAERAYEMFGAGMRDALEAAVPLLGPRPLLEASKPTVVDREAITEAAAIRDEYIEGQVNRRVAFRDGDVTTEQIEQWESEAGVWWANRWPALAALYPKATEGKA